MITQAGNKNPGELTSKHDRINERAGGRANERERTLSNNGVEKTVLIFSSKHCSFDIRTMPTMPRNVSPGISPSSLPRPITGLTLHLVESPFYFSTQRHINMVEALNSRGGKTLFFCYTYRVGKKWCQVPCAHAKKFRIRRKTDIHITERLACTRNLPLLFCPTLYFKEMITKNNTKNNLALTIRVSHLIYMSIRNHLKLKFLGSSSLHIIR